MNLGLSDEAKKKVYPEYIKIAVECITGNPEADPEGLVSGFNNFLNNVAKDIRKLGGTLKSRQVIVSLIHTYKLCNPKKELYSKYHL